MLSKLSNEARLQLLLREGLDCVVAELQFICMHHSYFRDVLSLDLETRN
jgi:hypothetical protein